MSWDREDFRFLSVGLVVCSLRVLLLAQTSLLCWFWVCSTYSSVWSGAVAVPTKRSLCHLSGRRLLFAERKRDGTKWARGGYLLLANTKCPPRWSTQLLLWPDSWLSSPWHCGVSSQKESLLNVIHALKLLMAIGLWWTLRIKTPPPALLLVNKMEIWIPERYWLMSTVSSALSLSLFFSFPVFYQWSLWSHCDSFQPSATKRSSSHLIHWCFSPQRSSWLEWPLCGANFFICKNWWQWFHIKELLSTTVCIHSPPFYKYITLHLS